VLREFIGCPTILVDAGSKTGVAILEGAKVPAVIGLLAGLDVHLEEPVQDEGRGDTIREDVGEPTVLQVTVAEVRVREEAPLGHASVPRYSDAVVQETPDRPGCLPFEENV
jgi:hypothetical protein